MRPSDPPSTTGEPTWFRDRPPRLGEFEIHDLIDHGAMGAVFKARQRSMDRAVAVKILKPRLARNPEYVERFWHEARAAARLNHPNIVLAIDVGQDRGLSYFVMEYVEGRTVNSLLKAGPFEEARALEVARQVAAALDYAWTQEHIVHRDIKPGNIIITPKDVVKLADLGLAHDPQLVADAPPQPNGAIVGTPLYIAPEQIRRQADLDVRCDLYGLGATLFHMLTGRPPYAARNSREALSAHLNAPVPDPRQLRPGLGDGLARIIMRLLAKERDERYPTAKALIDDIDTLLHPPQPRRAPSSRARTPRRHRRRRRASRAKLLLALLFLAVLAGGGIAAWLLTARPAAQARKPDRVASTRPGPAEPRPAAKAYAEAIAFVDAHPADFRQGIARLLAVERGYPGTEQAAAAGARRRKLLGARDAQAREAVDAIEAKAKASLAKGRYGEALAVFDTFPEHLATPAATRRLVDSRAGVQAEARQQFDGRLARADHLADEGELAEAIQAYRALADAAPANWHQAVATRLAAAQKALDDAGQKARAAELTQAYATVNDRLPELYHTRRYEQAVALLKAAIGGAPPEQHDALRAELAEAVRLVDFWAAVERGAAELVGWPTTLGGTQATVQSVKDGRITLKAADGDPTITHELIALPAADIVFLAASSLPPADLPVAKARFLVAEGHEAPAEAHLKTLEAEGTDVAALRARAKRFARAKPIEVARAAFGEITKLVALGNTDEAAAALTAFLERHGETKGAAELCLDATALHRKLTRPKPAFAADARPATLRVACDADYKVFINGQLLDDGPFRRGRFSEVDLKVTDGDVLAVEADSEAPAAALYAMLVVEGGRYALHSTPSWRWAENPPDDWRTAAKPGGEWEPAVAVYSPHAKPGYAQAAAGLEGYWLWGRGSRCCFRKTVRLAKTLAERAGEEQARQKALTTKLGAPLQATVHLACRNAYRLYHNGRHVGCAASFVPEGVAYQLPLRHGDVLAVHAYDLPADTGWLDARITLDGHDTILRTDRSWVYTPGNPPDDWNLRGAPAGKWHTPAFVDQATFCIRASAPAAYFRKTVDLKRAARRPLTADLIRGRIRTSGDKSEITYDFKDPEQLADWTHAGGWSWAKGRIGGTGGLWAAAPFDLREVQIELDVEPAGDLTLALSASPAEGRKAEALGYTLHLHSTKQRRGRITLRRNGTSLAAGQLTAARTSTRRLIFRKAGADLVLWADGAARKFIAIKDPTPIPHASLTRIGLFTGKEDRYVIRGIRITGRPKWDAIRASIAQRHDRDPLDGHNQAKAPPEPPPRDKPPKPPRKKRPREGAN